MEKETKVLDDTQVEVITPEQTQKKKTIVKTNTIGRSPAQQIGLNLATIGKLEVGIASRQKKIKRLRAENKLLEKIKELREDK